MGCLATAIFVELWNMRILIVGKKVADSIENTKLTIADLEMDTATGIVKRRNRRIDLTAKEYALLEFLMRHANRPVTRTMITEYVWDIHHDSASNVLDVH